MKTIKIFIASSSELKDDREQFEKFIRRKNDILLKKGINLLPEQWENTLEAVSITRSQDEYNKKIRQCDIVVCLFWTKAGIFTDEEFETAYQVFKDTGKPRIWTYFKTEKIDPNLNRADFISLSEFKDKISKMGHFPSHYNSIDNFLLQFGDQLDKFIQQYEESESSEIPRSDFKAGEVKQPVKNTFNEVFPVRLVEAIKPYNRKANDFLSLNNNWQSNADLITQAKRIIISGFVGIIGLQLRKLGAIGEEEFSDSKMKRYLENCQLTVKRALQLVCYVLISGLWDQLKRNSGQLSQAHVNILNKFFKSAVEETISGYAELLKTLLDIFSDANFQLPVPQLKELQTKLNTDSAFMQACTHLTNMSENLKNGVYTVDDCTQAENEMVIVLEHFSFLAEYKLISIKDIDYAMQRNDREGIYLHNYTLLDGESQANNNSQTKVRRENTPVISYSVLLCKDNLRQNINLDPFIIDFNSLALSGGSKICIFSFSDVFGDKSLNYSFIEDNSKITIRKSKNPKPDEKDTAAVNKWLSSNENKKDMNFDNVINLFEDAKKSLTGIEESITQDEL